MMSFMARTVRARERPRQGHDVTVTEQPSIGVDISAVILVEGASDRAAVCEAARLLGVDLAGSGVAVLPMGGAMSVRRFVAELGADGLGLPLRGVCDAGEVRFYERAGLPDEAIFVCRPDLEGELLRALGPDRAEALLAQEDDLRLFRTFQQQPAQRGRPIERQLHRFLGTTSGRKEHYGHVLTAALTADTLPAPLREVVSGFESRCG
jgi:hypothetical protein